MNHHSLLKKTVKCNIFLKGGYKCSNALQTKGLLLKILKRLVDDMYLYVLPKKHISSKVKGQCNKLGSFYFSL